MTQLNKVGEQLASIEGVHAMTDVTGFGLCGHLLEVARGSQLSAVVEYSKVCIQCYAKPIVACLIEKCLGVWSSPSAGPRCCHCCCLKGPPGHPVRVLLCAIMHAVTGIIRLCIKLGSAAVWLSAAQVPVMEHAAAVAQQGTFPGAVPRNLESYGQSVDFDQHMPEWQQHLLVDPQTSGGLLVAVAPDAVDRVLKVVREAGCSKAAVIGKLEAGEPRIRVLGAAPEC